MNAIALGSFQAGMWAGLFLLFFFFKYNLSQRSYYERLNAPQMFLFDLHTGSHLPVFLLLCEHKHRTNAALWPYQVLVCFFLTWLLLSHTKFGYNCVEAFGWLNEKKKTQIIIEKKNWSDTTWLFISINLTVLLSVQWQRKKMTTAEVLPGWCKLY